MRIAIRPDGRGPALAAEPAYVKGLVEVQDEGSQLAALLGEAKPGMQVLDLCAGAGGKTLALAAKMDNHGQVYATDADGRRLAPIFDRLARSGARNVQVRAPKGQADVLADLEGPLRPRDDRRALHRLGRLAAQPRRQMADAPGALEQRIKDQDETLESARRFVKPGGRIVYVTCSVLRAENEDRVAAFLSAHDDFLPVDAATQARAAGVAALAGRASPFGPGFRMTPRDDRHGRLLRRDARADVSRPWLTRPEQARRQGRLAAATTGRGAAADSGPGFACTMADRASMRRRAGDMS